MVTIYGGYDGYQVAGWRSLEAFGRSRPARVLRHLRGVGNVLPRYSYGGPGNSSALCRRDPILHRRLAAICFHALPRTAPANSVAMAQLGPFGTADVRGRIRSAVLGREICALRHRFGARSHAAAYHHGSGSL